MSVTTTEKPAERARRLGYVEHGEFPYRIAYREDIVSDKVVDTIRLGHYERFEGRRSRRFVADGDRVVELGGGLGFISTVIMDHHAVADYQVVEADPRLTEMIRRTHRLNRIEGPLTINSCVATCGEDLLRAGTVTFHVGSKFCASSLLEMADAKLKHTVEVPVVSLADMIATHRSNVLICDIEGAEVDVFNGTPLPTLTKILAELHPHRIGQSGIRELFRCLDAIGFVYEGDSSSGNVAAFRRLDPDPS